MLSRLPRVLAARRPALQLRPPALVSVRGAKWKPAGLAPPPPANDREQALAFVEERGYAPELAAAVVDSLGSSDWAPAASSAGGVLALSKRLAGRWEMGLDEGLADLAKSLEIQMAAKAGKQQVTFSVVPPRGAAFECTALEGMSLKEVAEHGDDEGARLLAEHLECACSGVMACSTCQVYVDASWFSTVGPPSEEEEDMLDLAFERRDESRLGCQLKLSPDLKGLRLTIPGNAHNMFDHIPFE